jgi:hypothetical protein
MSKLSCSHSALEAGDSAARVDPKGNSSTHKALGRRNGPIVSRGTEELSSDALALRDDEWAAKYLGLTTGWLAKLRMRGGGPKFVKMARRVFYRRADLDSWVAERIISSTSQTTVAARAGIDGHNRGYAGKRAA